MVEHNREVALEFCEGEAHAYILHLEDQLAERDRVIVAMRDALDAVDRSFTPAAAMRIPEIVGEALRLTPASLADMRLVPVDGVIPEIASERQRQVKAKGWTPEHDDEYVDCDLAAAAACYALSGVSFAGKDDLIAKLWPWAMSWWNPKDQRRDLIRAAALLVAEIERLDRGAYEGERGDG